MKSEIIWWLASESGYRVHVAVFILLILGGFGFPIPEDIPLLLAGVAGQRNLVKIQSIFITCYFGVLIADQIVFFIGYFFGQKLLSAGTKSPFFPAINEEKVNEIREGLRKKRLFYIFLGRHLFPVRTVTFLTAGTLRIPYLEFLLSDALAALLSVGIVVGIGYLLGEKLTPDVVETIVRDFHYFLAIVFATGLLIYALWKIWSKKNKNI